MQVVLLERISKLGQMGEVVNVKSGYARNFLLPQKKALRATDNNIKHFETTRVELEAKNLETKKEAEKFKESINNKMFTIIRSASDSGSLYGSVSARDAMIVSEEEGLKIEKRQIVLEKPIKDLGIHKVIIALHPEVQAEISLNVARSLEEAELQKSGKTIQDVAEEADKEAQQEIEELFDEVGSAALDQDEEPETNSSKKVAIATDEPESDK
jgi:large subunit ribosomal protein L9